MVDANCRNEGCGHSWTLRKHPSEYKRGVTCPECGTTRVELVGGTEQAPPQGAQAPAPAAQGGQQGGLPASPANIQEMAEVGMQGGQVADAILRGGTWERAAAAGAGLFQLANMQKQREQQGLERARSTSQDEIRKADVPKCPECGNQLQNIPDVGEFPCSRCGTLLERAPAAQDEGGQGHPQGAPGPYADDQGASSNKYRGPDEQV